MMSAFSGTSAASWDAYMHEQYGDNVEKRKKHEYDLMVERLRPKVTHTLV